MKEMQDHIIWCYHVIFGFNFGFSDFLIFFKKNYKGQPLSFFDEYGNLPLQFFHAEEVVNFTR